MSAATSSSGCPAVSASVLLVAAAIVDVQATATGRPHWRRVADELAACAAALVADEPSQEGVAP